LVDAQVDKLYEKKSKLPFRFSDICHSLNPDLDAFDKVKIKKLAKEQAGEALKKSV
jgi:hypothetical protein